VEEEKTTKIKKNLFVKKTNNTIITEIKHQSESRILSITASNHISHWT